MAAGALVQRHHLPWFDRRGMKFANRHYLVGLTWGEARSAPIEGRQAP